MRRLPRMPLNAPPNDEAAADTTTLCGPCKLALADAARIVASPPSPWTLDWFRLLFGSHRLYQEQAGTVRSRWRQRPRAAAARAHRTTPLSEGHAVRIAVEIARRYRLERSEVVLEGPTCLGWGRDQRDLDRDEPPGMRTQREAPQDSD